MKIYCLNLQDDIGELWLGSDKNPIEFVHCDDACFREEYQSFIISYLGGEFIRKSIHCSGDIRKKLNNASGDKEEMAEILKKEISKL